MVPSILINKAEGSKLVIGGAGGDLIIPAVVQVSLRERERPCHLTLPGVGVGALMCSNGSLLILHPLLSLRPS
jgi:hypothetical protein